MSVHFEMPVSAIEDPEYLINVAVMDIGQTLKAVASASHWSVSTLETTTHGLLPLHICKMQSSAKNDIIEIKIVALKASLSSVSVDENVHSPHLRPVG